MNTATTPAVSRRTIGFVAGAGSLAAGVFFMSCAQGGELDNPHFHLRGFGTLGATHSSQQDADFVGTLFQPKGAGHSQSWAFGVDSKLGLQLNADFSDRLTAVVQVVSQYGYEGNYQPQVEWANISYRVTPDLQLRIGRIVAATFMESEGRLVGYTYPWVRPPQELYGVNPATSKDGIDLVYQFPIGDTINRLQLSYGQSDNDLPAGGKGVVRNAFDAHHTLEFGDTTLRYGYRFLDLDIESPDLDALFDGFAQFGALVPGPAGERALANERYFRTEDSRYTIISAGFIHNPGNLLLRGEWARANIAQPTFASDVSAWYLTAGYRFGAITPFVSLAHIEPDKLDTPNIPASGLSPDLAQVSAGLDQGLDAVVNAFAFSQESVTLGVRWDIHQGVAFKFQYQHLSTADDSSGRLTNQQPGFHSGDSANLVSLAVDFVF